MFCGYPTISQFISYILKKSQAKIKQLFSAQLDLFKTVYIICLTQTHRHKNYLFNHLTSLYISDIIVSSPFFTAVFLIFDQILETLVSKIENILCLFLVLQQSPSLYMKI